MSETPAVTLMRLISEAMDDGFDVVLTMRERSDGKPGQLYLPRGWAEKISGDAALQSAKAKWE